MGWFPFGKDGTDEKETGDVLQNKINTNTKNSTASNSKTIIDSNNKTIVTPPVQNQNQNQERHTQTHTQRDMNEKLDQNSTNIDNENDSSNSSSKSYLFGLVTEVNPGGINNMYKINIPGVKSSTNDNTRCVNMVNESIKEQKIQFLAKSLDELGCSFSWSDMIECEPCKELCHAMFHGNEKGLKEGEYKPKLTVCENYMISKPYTTRAIAHELIHAYDQCRAKMDYQNIEHLACTEIRAAALSGDCDIAAEFDRGNFNLKGQHQACVKRRAIAAIMTGVQDQSEMSNTPQISQRKEEDKETKKILIKRPLVDEVEATLAVERVWSECYKDTNPFPGIPPP